MSANTQLLMEQREEKDNTESFVGITNEDIGIARVHEKINRSFFLFLKEYHPLFRDSSAVTTPILYFTRRDGRTLYWILFICYKSGCRSSGI